MGWFDEQIRSRKIQEEEDLEDALLGIAGAVTGRRMISALRDSRRETRDALDEILKYYHVKSREVPDDVRDQNEILEYLMRPYGIMRRRVNLDPGWRKDASGAMLGTLTEDGSVVALIPGRFSGYSYLDPSTGDRVRVDERSEKLIDRESVAFYKPFPLKKMDVRDLLLFILENITTSDVMSFLLLTGAVTLLGMLVPFLTRELLGGAALAPAAAFLLSASISRLLIDSARSLSLARIETRLNLAVEAASMMRILSLPAGFFKKFSAGELSSRSRYISSFCSLVLNTGIAGGITSVFSLLYVTQIFMFAPSLVIPSLLVIFATVLISAVSSLMQMGISRRLMEISAKENGMGYALISGIQKIRLSGAEKRAFARWGRLYAREAELQYSPPLFLKVNSVITMGISLFGTLIIYYIAGKSGITVQDYYAFNTAYGMVAGAFFSFSSAALSLAGIRPILEMAKPILETVPEIAEGKAVVNRLSGGVELNNVLFRYGEDMPYILDNLSLKIKPGQYVAVVGQTGCGKSTLIRLLLGFETPEKGAVYYDGRNLQEMDLRSLRRKIGVVLQNGKLFAGDIFSNITISAPWLTMDDAWEAAELSGIAEDIRKMPMGMHTLISEGQGGISGGQRQRIMIARAIAPKPKILIFDEATSALDNLTQKQVSDALSSLKCTRIVVAHRLSTIRSCDRIIVLDRGGIAEDGTYEELMEKKGLFYELAERQRA